MNKKLPDFQNFLTSNKLVPQKNIPFYAYWVSEFLSFSNKHEDLTLILRIQKFLQQLNYSKTIEDWQIQQAETDPRSPLDKIYTNNRY